MSHVVGDSEWRGSPAPAGAREPAEIIEFDPSRRGEEERERAAFSLACAAVALVAMLAICAALSGCAPAASPERGSDQITQVTGPPAVPDLAQEEN